MVGPSRHFLALALAFVLGAAGAGCKQGNGERCEVNRDCGDGLYCDPSSGDNSGGICKPNPTEADSGTVVDAGQTAADADAAADAADAAEDAPEERGPDAATDAVSAPDSATETPSEDGAGEESGG